MSTWEENVEQRLSALEAAVFPPPPNPEPPDPEGTARLEPYDNPRHIPPWGSSGHYCFSARAWQETPPSSRILEAPGLVCNSPFYSQVARVAASAGFKRLRAEFGWNNMAYGTAMLAKESLAKLTSFLQACETNDIRPLILLNANDGGPCPSVPVKLFLASNLQLKSEGGWLLGPNQLQLDKTKSELAKIVPGRTGIRTIGAENRYMARYLITAVDTSTGIVTLSQRIKEKPPLFPNGASSGVPITYIQAGELPAATLEFEPFTAASLPEGGPNPGFEPTMNGWLSYVDAVTREASRILGHSEFDVEVWNELSFGSRFLDRLRNYYGVTTEGTALDTNATILRRTAEFVAAQTDGRAVIKVCNGFSNTTPWASGATVPAEVAAICKHPYHGWDSFPKTRLKGRPINGRLEPAGWRNLDALNRPTGEWQADFEPAYESFCPEYFLTGLQTETVARDLAPFLTQVGGTPHGRFSRPDSGEMPVMITEVNLRPGDGPRKTLTEAERRRMMAKFVLRYLVSYTNKGIGALHFYTARDKSLGLIDEAFFAPLTKAKLKEDPDFYPGNDVRGPVLDAVARLLSCFEGLSTTPRELNLEAVVDFAQNKQFEGKLEDESYPPLWNRDRFLFLPFQDGDKRFVCPYYVATTNAQEDLPEETYRLVLEGVRGLDDYCRVYDPLTDVSMNAPVIWQDADSERAIVEVVATDSPRVLEIQEV